jgi:hypothetical protein
MRGATEGLVKSDLDERRNPDGRRSCNDERQDGMTGITPRRWGA